MKMEWNKVQTLYSVDCDRLSADKELVMDKESQENEFEF